MNFSDEDEQNEEEISSNHLCYVHMDGLIVWSLHLFGLETVTNSLPEHVIGSLLCLQMFDGIRDVLENFVVPSFAITS